jgi:hypothetical protein
VGPVDHSARLRGGVGSSSIHPTLLTTREWLLYADHVRYVWSRAYADRAWNACGVFVRFSLAWCTSI